MPVIRLKGGTAAAPPTYFKTNNKLTIMTRKEEIEQFANEQVQGAEKLYGYKYSIKDVKYAFEAGAEWADRTMIDKVCEFIRINAYKYGKVKFIDNGATFDFRTNTFLNDLKKAMEE